jgi:hypothetical protein
VTAGDGRFRPVEIVVIVQGRHASAIAAALIDGGYQRDEPLVDEAASLAGTEYLAAPLVPFLKTIYRH